MQQNFNITKLIWFVLWAFYSKFIPEVFPEHSFTTWYGKSEIIEDKKGGKVRLGMILGAMGREKK